MACRSFCYEGIGESEEMIYKYPLKVTPVQEIEIPHGSCFLTLQVQREIPCLWFATSKLKLSKVTVHTIGTGEPIPKLAEHRYAGTYQLDEFVGHVFFEFAEKK